MHYIRLLRPAKFDASDKKPFISLLLTITTDLGDSFLHPDEPIDLIIAAEAAAGGSLLLETGRPPRWSAGMRVLDVKAPVKPHLKSGDVTCSIKIHPAAVQSLPLGRMRTSDVLPWSVTPSDSPARKGLIMPATVEMVNGVCSPVCIRTLRLSLGPRPGDELDLDFEEDIGESIARHVWDAGVVTASFLADACRSAEAGIRDVLPLGKESVGVLELGSGVGILGISFAGILGRAAGEAMVLLTDVPEAEERARANVARAETALSRAQIYSGGGSVPTIRYENLDWERGRRGQLGPLASARAWDLVVLSDCTYNVDSLPALVGTLSALHAANLRHPGVGGAVAKSSVLLATKPRHSSETALFGLLEASGWRYRVLKSIPLPKLGEEEGGGEVVDIYVLEKGGVT
ncbi:hypothetical protein AAE478_010365 [Parahypoxylon ruwenzoriense]